MSSYDDIEHILKRLDAQDTELLKQTNGEYLGLVSLQSDCIDSAFLDVDNTQALLINFCH